MKRKLLGAVATARIFKPIAALLGPQFTRSPDCIEIDVTYACNLACYNCNRSVRQAPSRDSVSAEQIAEFLRESVAKDVRWKRIRLLGGEPTVHGQLHEIVALLLDYKRDHSPFMALSLHTNGFGKRVNSVLAELPQEVEIVNSAKSGDVNPFNPFNEAPRDSPLHTLSDYSMGCRVPEKCGQGLTPYGYYPCAVAGAIDRVLGLDIGRKELPDSGDPMRSELRELCQWCGNFRRGGYYELNPTVQDERISRSWQRAYANYAQAPPELSRYAPKADSNSTPPTTDA